MARGILEEYDYTDNQFTESNVNIIINLFNSNEHLDAYVKINETIDDPDETNTVYNKLIEIFPLPVYSRKASITCLHWYPIYT